MMTVNHELMLTSALYNISLTAPKLGSNRHGALVPIAGYLTAYLRFSLPACKQEVWFNKEQFGIWSSSIVEMFQDLDTVGIHPVVKDLLHEEDSRTLPWLTRRGKKIVDYKNVRSWLRRNNSIEPLSETLPDHKASGFFSRHQMSSSFPS